MDRKTVAAHIVNVSKKLHQKNFLAACDGNISVKLSDDEILVTPSGVPKCEVTSEGLATVKLDGTVVSGKPSSELSMHLSVYRNCSKAVAVVHAHPPQATAWSVAFPETTSLPEGCLSELILACGSIPIIPFAMPGSKEMGSHIFPNALDHRVMILSRHGALTWGEDLQEAYNGMERLEHTVQILSSAHLLGGLTELGPAQIEQLKELRTRIGERTL